MHRMSQERLETPAPSTPVVSLHAAALRLLHGHGHVLRRGNARKRQARGPHHFRNARLAFFVFSSLSLSPSGYSGSRLEGVMTFQSIFLLHWC